MSNTRYKRRAALIPYGGLQTCAANAFSVWATVLLINRIQGLLFSKLHPSGWGLFFLSFFQKNFQKPIDKYTQCVYNIDIKQGEVNEMKTNGIPERYAKIVKDGVQTEFSHEKRVRVNSIELINQFDLGFQYIFVYKVNITVTKWNGKTERDDITVDYDGVGNRVYKILADVMYDKLLA